MIYNSESTRVCLVYIDPLLVNITNSSDKGDDTEDSDEIYKCALNLHDPCNDW